MKTATVLALILTGMGAVATVSPAQAATFSSLTDLTGDGEFNDADYLEYAWGSDRTFTSQYVFESRIGNNGTNGDWETGAFASQYLPDESSYSNTIVAGSQRQRIWNKQTPVQFSLEYTGSQLIYRVGTLAAITLEVDPTKGPITDLMIRTAAGLKTTSNAPTNPTKNTSFSQIMLSNLAIGSASGSTGSSFSRGEVTSTRNRDVDYLRVSGLGNAPFTLTGDVEMDWGDAAPTGSNLAFQIKVGSTPTEEVPEPGVLGALAVGGVALLTSQRKRKAAQPS